MTDDALHHVEANGLRFAYLEQGEGPLVLLLHGFPDTPHTWDAARPPGQRIVPGSLRLHGRAIAPDEPLRITVNSFLAGGGDLFDAFKAGRDRRTGVMDIDALEAHVRGGAVVDDGPRLTRLN